VLRQKRFRRSFALFRTRDEEHDAAAGPLQDGEGQRSAAGDLRGGDVHGGDGTKNLRARASPGTARGVTVDAQAQQPPCRARKLAALACRSSAISAAYAAAAPSASAWLAAHAKIWLAGTGLATAALRRQSGSSIRMIGRHGALVAEEDPRPDPSARAR